MDARKFVETLFGGREGFIEFRLIGGGKATQHFHKISDVLAKWDECLNVLKKANASGANVYFGAVPRTVAKGDAASVAPTTILWADIDDKSSAVNENFKPLIGLNLAPSIVVDSGHGWHCYWILREPLGNETARTIMDEIARVVGGDNVSDPPRILRLPDTFNTKSSPSVLCRVVKADTSRLYNPSDFDRLKDLPSAPGAKAKAKGTEPPKA